MKKTLLVLAGVIFLLLVAVVLVAPAFIDWNRYRPEVASRLQAAIGREVAIGELSLALLPVPALEAEGVQLANLPGATDPALASVDAVRLRLSVTSLLAGEVRVDSLQLVRPVVSLEELADGQVNWRFGDAPPAPSGEQAAGPRSEGGGMPLEVRFDEILVEDGVLVYRSPGQGRQAIEGVEATVSADSLDGPFHVRGSARYGATPVTFEFALGRIETGRAAPLSVGLQLPEQKAQARLSGQLGGNADLRGRLSVSGDDLAAVVAALAAGRGVPKAAAAPFAVDGTLAIGDAKGALNDLAFRVGGTQGTGALTASFGEKPTVDLTASVARLDLDQWLAPAPAAKPGGATRQQAAPAAPAAAGGADEGGFTIPGNLGGGLSLSADAVVYRGGVIRQFRLDARLADGRLRVNQAAALLPGGSDASVYGELSAAGGRPYFDGGFELASDNLRGVLDWLGVDVGDVPAERLRKFSAVGQLRGSPSEFGLSELDVRLDTSRLNGAATIRVVPRLAVGANLVVDNINVDAYRSAGPRLAPPGDGVAEAGQPAQPRDPAAAAPLPSFPLLSAFDANVKARVGQFTLNDVTVQDLLVDGTLVNGDVTLRQASIGEFGGLSGRVSGGLLGLGSGRLQFRDLDYAVKAGEAGKLFRLLDIEPPVAPDRLGSIALTGTLDGSLDELALETRSEAGGTVVSLVGKVTQPFAARRYDLAVEASHASFTQLVRLFQPDYTPAGSLGGFALTSRVVGDAAALTVSDLRAKLGPVSVAGEVRVGLTAKPTVVASLQASEVNLNLFAPAEQAAVRWPPREEWLGGEPGTRPAAATTAPVRPESSGAGEPWSRDGLDLGWLGLFDAEVQAAAPALTWRQYRVEGPVMRFTLADGLGKVDRFEGALFGGHLALTGEISATGGAQGRLNLANAQVREALIGAAGIDLADGLVTAEADLATTGRSVFEMVSRLAGEARLDVRNGVVRGLDLGAISRRLNDIDSPAKLLELLRAGTAGGQTGFSRLAGTFRVRDGVVVTNDLAIDAEAATGHADATVNLPAYTIDARSVFRLTDHPRAPAFVVMLQGPLDDPRRVFDTTDLQRWLISRGLGKVLKDQEGTAGEVGRVLRGIIEGQPPPAAPTPAPTPAPAASAPATPEAPAAEPAPAAQPAVPAPAQPATPAPQAPPPAVGAEAERPRPEDLIERLMREIR